MFQHCLICTDFTDGLQRLASFVEDLAQTGLRKLVFLHTVSVWEDERVAQVDAHKLEEGRAYLEGLVQGRSPEVEVKIEVSSMRYLDRACQLIQQEAIDLVITGMPVRSNLESTLFGSHTLALAKATEVPVLVLRPQLISTYTTEELALRCQHLWQHLLVPYDGSAAGRYLIERLQRHLTHHPSVQSCRLLWVLEDNVRRPEIQEVRLAEAQAKLAEVQEQLSPLVPSVVTDIRQGNPLQEILDTAFTHDISAIAVGNYRANLLDWTVPSLANNILSRSWFPLLFFSPKG